VKLGIVSSGRGWQSEELFRRALEKGWEVYFFPPRRFSLHLPDNDVWSELEKLKVDAILVRSVPFGSLDQIIFRIDALYLLEMQGIPVVNSPWTIERTVDKVYSSMLLSTAGIPTPRTAVCERFSDAMEWFKRLGGDVIVKPIFGANGVGIVRVSDIDMAHRVFRALQLTRSVFYIQEFIPHRDEDIRVFVAGGEIVAAMLRKGSAWKTNIYQGGKPIKYDLPRELEEMCLKISSMFKADYLGVDLMFSESGELYVLEVNGIPGWRGIQSVSKRNIADAILSCVEKKKRRI